MEKINYDDVLEIKNVIDSSFDENGQLAIVSECSLQVMGKTAALFINLIASELNRNGKFGLIGGIVLAGKIIKIVVEIIVEFKKCKDK